MISNNRRITVIFCIILAVCLMTGCQSEEKIENVQDEVVSMEFSKEDATFGYRPLVTFTTKERTFVWSISEITNDTTFVKTEDPIDTVTYELDEDGDIHNKKIYLSDDGLQKYSEAYAKVFSESLKVVNE